MHYTEIYFEIRNQANLSARLLV